MRIVPGLVGRIVKVFVESGKVVAQDAAKADGETITPGGQQRRGECDDQLFAGLVALETFHGHGVTPVFDVLETGHGGDRQVLGVEHHLGRVAHRQYDDVDATAERVRAVDVVDGGPHAQLVRFRFRVVRQTVLDRIVHDVLTPFLLLLRSLLHVGQAGRRVGRKPPQHHARDRDTFPRPVRTRHHHHRGAIPISDGSRQASRTGYTTSDLGALRAHKHTHTVG